MEEQIQHIKAHFTQAIFDLAKLSKLRQRVASTAVVYMRTVYLRNSFCHVDPRLMFAGCLYLASKAEESLIAAKHLVAFTRKLRPGWPYDIKHLLDAEMEMVVSLPGSLATSTMQDHMLAAVIMQELDFNLVVFSPYQPLAEFIRDAGAISVTPHAWSVLNDSYRTDLHLMYPPHLMALSALVLAARLAGYRLEPWLEKLDIDMNQVYDITMDMLTMYEKYRILLTLDECDCLLDVLVAVKRRP